MRDSRPSRAPLLFTDRLFALPPELIAALAAQREARAHDPIARAHDAFLLDPGLGPTTYLTSDGRILWDPDMWEVRGTRSEAFIAVAIGVQKTGIAALRELLPPRAADAIDCEACTGTGHCDPIAQLIDTQGRAISIVCRRCAGLGWSAPSLLLDESVLPQH